MKNKLEEVVWLGRIVEEIDLFPYLSMRLHTKARYFFEAKTADDLEHVFTVCKANKLPLFFLAGGSNLIFKNTAVDGMVVKNSYSGIKVASEGSEYITLSVASGTPMSLLIGEAIEAGSEGLSYHKGLPGSVGGAIYMNSKWTKPPSSVGDFLSKASLIDVDGNQKKVDQSYFQFSQGYSILQKTHEILIDATFKLKKGDTKKATEQATFAFSHRQQTQPTGVATCGCFFRNISEKEQKDHDLPTKSAGYLIDQCGLKGYAIGGFAVSDTHANFIINTGKGDARPEDLLRLVEDIKLKVNKQFGIILKEEVEIK